MELYQVKLLQRIADQAEKDFRAARLVYIQEHLAMDVRPVRIAYDLGVSRQYLNGIIREISPAPQPEAQG